nr:hypothetical protein Iba_chr01eCG1630 [Ipomoea batatas]
MFQHAGIGPLKFFSSPHHMAALLICGQWVQ